MEDELDICDLYDRDRYGHPTCGLQLHIISPFVCGYSVYDAGFRDRLSGVQLRSPFSFSFPFPFPFLFHSLFFTWSSSIHNSPNFSHSQYDIDMHNGTKTKVFPHPLHLLNSYAQKRYTQTGRPGCRRKSLCGGIDCPHPSPIAMHNSLCIIHTEYAQFTNRVLLLHVANN